jgi:hypothetical protein
VNHDLGCAGIDANCGRAVLFAAGASQGVRAGGQGAEAVSAALGQGARVVVADAAGQLI